MMEDVFGRWRLNDTEKHICAAGGYGGGKALCVRVCLWVRLFNWQQSRL